MRVLLLPLLVLLSVLAGGCIGPDQDPGPKAQEPTEVDQCTTAAGAWILLERHTDHGGGPSEFWHIDGGGNVTIVAARPILEERTRVTFTGPWTETERNELCGVMASFIRQDPDTGAMVHQSIQIMPHDVHTWRVDPARVGQAIEGFSSLDPDSSAGCLSGGDTWMRVDNGTVQHTVEAACAPDAAFGAVLAAFFEAVDRPSAPHVDR